MSTITIEDLLKAKKLVEDIDKGNPWRTVVKFKGHPTSIIQIERAIPKEVFPPFTVLGIPCHEDEKIPLGELHGFDCRDRLSAIFTLEGIMIWQNK